MKGKTLFLRGKRIVDQLNSDIKLDETTVSQLTNKTLNFRPPSKRRQHATAPIQVVKLQLTPGRGQRDTGTLTAKAVVNSGNTVYESIVLFYDVIYEDADRADNITFVGPGNQEFHILPIDLNKNNTEVRCECLDFYYTFAEWNNQDKSLFGEVPPPYVRKTTTRQPRNPARAPGMCKHLLKVVQELKNERLVR